ncbi:MAG: PilZ domain-containing protein [Deltaproteobacteria bacterium]|nr:PilZ domain-containing protein [Deltaproteobacteria bacterium]
MTHESQDREASADPHPDISAAVDAELLLLLEQAGLTPQAVEARPLAIPAERISLDVPPSNDDLEAELGEEASMPPIPSFRAPARRDLEAQPPLHAAPKREPAPPAPPPFEAEAEIEIDAPATDFEVDVSEPEEEAPGQLEASQLIADEGLDHDAFAAEVEALSSPPVAAEPQGAAGTSPPPVSPTLDLRIPRSSMDAEEDALPHDERRTAKRYRLKGNVVSVAIFEGKGDPGIGRVRDISVTGGFFIETRSPLPRGTSVCASVIISSGQALSFEGRVVRSSEDGFALNLQSDEIGQAFLNVAVAVARGAAQSRTVEVKVVPVEETSDAGRVEVDLSRRWHNITLDERNDELHQKFIEACLSAKRVDYALERYRALKRRSPDDTQFDRYLEQVGKILSFVALQKGPEGAHKRKMSRTTAVLLVVLVLMGLLWAMMRPR